MKPDKAFKFNDGQASIRVSCAICSDKVFMWHVTDSAPFRGRCLGEAAPCLHAAAGPKRARSPSPASPSQRALGTQPSEHAGARHAITGCEETGSWPACAANYRQTNLGERKLHVPGRMRGHSAAFGRLIPSALRALGLPDPQSRLCTK